MAVGDIHFSRLKAKPTQVLPGSFSSGVFHIPDGVKIPSIYPTSDSSTSIQIRKADNTTTVLGVDTTNVRIGVGGTPQFDFHVVRPSGTYHYSMIDSYNDEIQGPTLGGRSARGTYTSPTATALDDSILRVTGAGYYIDDVASFTTSRARISFHAAENFTSTKHGTYISVFTTLVGTTNTLERIRITDVGNLGLNTTIPRKKLDVLDSSAAQLRLSHTDNSVYTDFQTSSGGDLTITPSGGDLTISGNISASNISSTSGANRIPIADGEGKLNSWVSIAGPTGPTGSQGVLGITGPTGTDGLQGNQGTQGNQGNQGNQGFLGVTGPTGSQGNQGTQGNQGVPGPSITVNGTAGAALAQYDIVYSDAADSGEYKKAKADVVATCDAVGIALAAIENSAVGEIAIDGKLVTNAGWSALTPGGTVYLSKDTAGAITQTIPTTGYIKPLGYAITATQILFSPELGYPAEDALTNLDGDKVVIDWNPANSTPAIVTESTTVDHLASHLKGVDNQLGYDVVGGRMDLAAVNPATNLQWTFLTSNQIRLFNTSWELVKLAAQPTLANTDVDLAGTALAVNKIYDVFAEYGTATALANTNKLSVSRWLVATAGASTRNAAYAAGTTYAIGDRVTYGGNDWVKISTAAAGTTPVAGAAWTDNGTSVVGDFAGLYQHEGVWVQANSAAGKKRRWLGVIYLSAAGTFLDDVNNRFVSNYYNRRNNPVRTNNTTTQWQYQTNTWRVSNNQTGQVYGRFMSCVTQSSLFTSIQNFESITAGGAGGTGCGLNITTGDPIACTYNIGAAVYNQVEMSSSYAASIYGYNFICTMERGDNANNNYFNGGANTSCVAFTVVGG